MPHTQTQKSRLGGAWGADGVRRDKKRNGRELAGRRWDAMPAAQA